jgi:hypothetical protein
VTNFCNDTYWNRETKSLQLDLHDFNPPPKEISYKGDNEVLHHKEGRAWGLNSEFILSRIKGCRLNMK